MDPRIVPTDRLGSAILAALQTPQGDAQAKALLAFVGESLDLVLLTKEGGTARLQLPSGQIIEAQGDLPYPPGTRLTVQVLPPGAEQTAPRLKLVEAVPPAPLPILAPLQQGEALQLLARLTVPETPPELAALARLFAALGAGAGEAVREAPDGRAEAPKDPPTGPDRTPVEAAKPAPPPAAPPSSERIVATLKELPPAVLRELQRILFPTAGKPPSLEDMAETLRRVLQTLEAEGAAAGSSGSEVSVPKAERGGPPLASPALPAAVPKAPLASAPPPSTAAAQEVLKLLQQSVLGTVAAAPSRNADPALEPLKNFLLLLLKPSRPDEPPAPPPRVNLDRPPAEAAPPPAEDAAPEAAAVQPAPRAEAPTRESILTMLEALPPEVLRDLQRVLLPAAHTPPSLPETADVLATLLETTQAGQPAGEAARAQLKTLQDLLGPLAASAEPALELLNNLLRPGSKTVSAQPAEGAPPTAPTASLAGPPAAQAAQAEPPTREHVVALLKELPPAVLQDLRRILFPAATEPASLAEIAETLRILLEAAGPAQSSPEKASPRSPLVTAPSSPGPSEPTGTTAPSPAGSPLATLNEAVQKLLERIQAAMPLPRLASTVAPGVANPAQETLQNLLQFLLQPPGEPAGRALAELIARAGVKAFGAEPTLIDLAAAGLPVAVPAEPEGPGTPSSPAGEPGKGTGVAGKASVAPAAAELPAEPPGPPTRLPGEVLPRATEPPAIQAALPSTGRIVALLRDLPPALLQDFQRILFPGASKPPSMPELAEALRGILRALGEAPLPKGGSPQLEAMPIRSVPPSPSQAPTVLPSPSAEESFLAAPAAGSRQAPAKEPLLTAGQWKPGGAAPTATGPPGGEPAAASEELLRRVQQAMSGPVQALPPLFFQGGGDPALEPLKNLLMFLLRPTFTADSGGQALADLLAKAAAPPPPETAAAPRPGAESKQPPTPEPGPVLESSPKTHAAPLRHGEVPKGMPATPPTQASERSPAPIRGQDPPAVPRPAAAESQALAAKSWESWLSEGVKALSDPQSSPREAPFHLAQAREGTAFFELPLPWEGPGKVLQMWVESDQEGDSRGTGDRTRRVLVGLHFSALGETRVGIVQAGDRLQVRVWAEHAELLRSREDVIRSSLSDLGPDLDFQVLPLGEPGDVFPSLRSLAAGTGFDALG